MAITREVMEQMMADNMRIMNDNLAAIHAKIDGTNTVLQEQRAQMHELSERVQESYNNAPRTHVEHNRMPPQVDVDRDVKLFDLHDFSGEGDAEDFLEWVRSMEKVFDYKQYDDEKSFRVATLKLAKFASLWYESLRGQRLREGEPRIETWTELKRHMKRQFLPQ